MSKHSIPDDEFFDRLAERAPLPVEPAGAGAKLKSRIYSALMLREAAAGRLAGFAECKAAGHGLCVFEELVRIAPVSAAAKSSNICRVCHARVLAEHLDRAPIYWPHCPYAEFHRS
ncbi:MAG TPA: hypothetical protein VMI94_06120 [Bryobacteraceae bacterium]|nr:hypothetical protein [Bryobacteraceae bacterium]